MSDRVLERLERVFALGPGPHADRPGLSALEEQACELVAGWMGEAGLAVDVDPAGNVVGVLAGAEPGLGAVWTGSHLDTVPGGGRFDGALGVVGGLEALRRVAAGGGRPRRSLAVVAFRDEEGWRFGGGWFGSRALCGRLAPGELEARDRDGVSVAEALRALGRDAPPPGGWLQAARPAAFVELHVEQGPRLADLDAPLGVVDEIVGMAGLEVEFAGRAGHAGTTPMAGRADALRAAAGFVAALPAVAERAGAGAAVATVGDLRVEPGAANVIPGHARCAADLRAAGADGLERLERLAVEAAERAAADAGCTARAVPAWRAERVGLDAGVGDALRAAAAEHGLAAPTMASWAGHDAGVLAAAGVPTAMLFVRSLAGGVSHTPAEHSDAADVELAIDVLAAALRTLAG